MDDDAFGYRHGQYKDNELKDPAKLLLDLINGLDLCKKGMYEKIEVSCNGGSGGERLR